MEGGEFVVEQLLFFGGRAGGNALASVLKKSNEFNENVCQIINFLPLIAKKNYIYFFLAFSLELSYYTLHKVKFIEL